MADSSRKSFLLRIDPKLWDEIESWAKDELRSVNGQIEFILRDAVRGRRRNRVKEDETPYAGGGDVGGD